MTSVVWFVVGVLVGSGCTALYYHARLRGLVRDLAAGRRPLRDAINRSKTKE